MFTWLEKQLSASKGSAWFTIYLAIFLLLNEISVAIMDRWARPDGGTALEQLQTCALTLLAHWQYFHKHDFKHLDFNELSKTQLRSLSDTQARFIQESLQTMQAEGMFLVGCIQSPWEGESRLMMTPVHHHSDEHPSNPDRTLARAVSYRSNVHTLDDRA